MVYDVFVCHASGDKPVANAVVDALEGRGLRCWIAPRDVVPGRDYAQAIVEGISSSRMLVLIHSAEANNSPHVRREVERAAARDIPILPFRIQEITLSPSLEYFVSSSQWFDATSPPPEQHLTRLADTVFAELGVEEVGDGGGGGGEGPGFSRVPRNHLAEFVTRFGAGLADEPRRVQALLRDVAGEFRSEIAVLVAAAEEGVGGALIASSEGMAGSTASRLVQQLQQNRAIEQGAAEWAVTAWAHALGVPIPPFRSAPDAPPPGPAPGEPFPDATRPVGFAGPGGASDRPPPLGPGPREQVPPVPAPPPGAPEPVRTATGGGSSAPPPPPPPPPPPSPPPSSPGRDRDGDQRNSALIIGIVAIVALVVGGGVIAALALGGGDGQEVAGGASGVTGISEVFLEPVEEDGPDPFTESVAVIPTVFRRDLMPQPAPPEESPVPGAIQTVLGGAVGLYGGTRDNSSCNRPQMIEFLEENADKARAWAEAQGIDVDGLAGYIEDLTPLLLTQDTRVTNHGFSGGRATPRQSILEAGTAVLVDTFGVPRARCACGNPLEEPQAVSSPTYVGAAWREFDPESVAVIQAAAAPLEEFVVRDVATGDPFERPVATDGTGDRGSAVILPGPAGGTTTTTPPAGPPVNDVVLTMNVAGVEGATIADQRIEISLTTTGQLNPLDPALTVGNAAGEFHVVFTYQDPEGGCFIEVVESGPLLVERVSLAGGAVPHGGGPPRPPGPGAREECEDELGTFPTQIVETWEAVWEPATGRATLTIAEETLLGVATVTPAGSAPATTTTVATVETDVTAEGTVGVSSVFSSDFAAGLGVDGDITTSWFSAGSNADGPASVFEWTGPGNEEIASVTVISNAAHSVQDFRTGFGYASAVVTIHDASGAEVFRQSVDLPGTPDPNIVVFPNVVGRTVRISLQGHEDPGCGGFAELIVKARRPSVES